jgi:HTH-like domain
MSDPSLWLQLEFRNDPATSKRAPGNERTMESVASAANLATEPGRVFGRRGPKAAWSDAELLEKIREVIDASAFRGEGYRKVWAGLHFAQTRTSKARVLRLMPEAGTRP